MKYKIHAIGINIRKNKSPAIKVITSKGEYYTDQIIIHGESKIVYRPNKPLRDGAKLWIETDADIELIV